MTKTGKELVQAAQQEIPSISCAEFRSLENAEEAYVLLDVREQSEFDAGHIDGAVHVPRGFLEFQIEKAVPAKDTRIIICCASGGRASLAGKTLHDMGYMNIAFLEGGYQGYCETQ